MEACVQAGWKVRNSKGRTRPDRVFELLAFEKGGPRGRAAREHARWQEIKMTVDSGACDHVIPPKQVCQTVEVDTPAVRNAVTYCSASGHPLPNLGEVKVQGETNSGGNLELTMQVAGVKKPLASVRKMCQAGNRVVFDDAGDYVENKQTGIKIPITQEDGTYQVSLWVELDDTRRKTLEGNMFNVLQDGAEDEEEQEGDNDVSAFPRNEPGTSSSSGFPRRA